MDNDNSLVEYYRPTVNALMGIGNFNSLGEMHASTTALNASRGLNVPAVTNNVYEDVARLSMVAGNHEFSKYVANGVDPASWNYNAIEYALNHSNSILRLIFEKELGETDLDQRFYFASDVSVLYDDNEEYYSVIEDLHLEDGLVLDEGYDLHRSLTRIAELICNHTDLNTGTEYMTTPRNYELVAYCMAIVRAGRDSGLVNKICRGDGRGSAVYILTECTTIEQPFTQYLDKVSLALMIIEETFDISIAEYLKTAPELRRNAKLLDL